MVGAYGGAAFPMTNLLAAFNVDRALARKPAVGDLSAAISPTGVAFSLLLMATRVLPKIAAQGLVWVNMLERRFMAHCQLTGALLGATLQAQQSVRLLFHQGRYCVGIADVLRTFSGYFTRLLGTVLPKADIATQLPADAGLMPIQQLGYLRLIVSGFHEDVNLMSFSLAEVFVGHKRLRLLGQEALNAKHPKRPNLQFVKVALRA